MPFKHLVLPLLVCIILYNNSIAQEKVYPKPNAQVISNGNKFDLYCFPKDTLDVTDPTSGEQTQIITSRSNWFISMNGERIKAISEKKGENSTVSDYDDSYHKLVTKTILPQIERNIQELAPRLKKGIYTYSINNIIIDKNGRVVFQEPSGVTKVRLTDLDDGQIPKEIITNETQDLVRYKIKTALESSKLNTYETDGKKRIVCLQMEGDFEIL